MARKAPAGTPAILARGLNPGLSPVDLVSATEADSARIRRG